MNNFSKTFLGILIVLIPAALALGLFFNKLTQKSFYSNSGELYISGIKSPVKIYSDSYGVPHIMAENDDDLFFAMGYIHARDRLWQMDVSRRAAEGRLSEIFGKNTVDVDKLFRTIGIGRFSYKLFENISPKSREILKSYSNGVNKFIETHYNELPVEFDVLDYKPDMWKPEHSLMIARLMGWDLNHAWTSDYVLGEIIDKVGIEKTSEIFPDTSMSIYQKPKALDEETESNTLNHSSIKNNFKLLKETALLGEDFFNSYQSYRNFFNINCSHTGSNSWVVSGEKSESGKPILANDPHLGFQAPSKWYEAHLKSKDADVLGMSLPGTPSVIIGHNKFIAWGLTNLMNDDTDFFTLEYDSADYQKYKYQNQSYFLDSLVERISVKDSAEVSFTIKYTKLGTVISELKNGYKNKLLTFKWTGLEFSDEFNAFYKINTAKNWDEFKSGLKDFGVPAQNFVYADINGNIGYHAAGKIPVRESNVVSDFIFPSAAESEWVGFIDFDKLPNDFNPKEGFIVTANTNPFDWLKVDEKNRYYISYFWETSSRFDKIKENLIKKTNLSLSEFKLLQMNYESQYAKETSKFIIDAFKDYKIEDSYVNLILDYFKNWNGEMKADESFGAVYNVFFIELLKNIYLDELGEKIFQDFLNVGNLPLRATRILLNQTDSIQTGWFDDINTSLVETKDEIVRKSFLVAVNFLKSKFNSPDVNSWRWGKIHKVKFKHPMGVAPALDKTFNIGHYEVGGDQTTVNNSEYDFYDAYKHGRFDNVLGPSMRMIVDLSDIQHSYSVNTTGQSGQPLHPNYQDQTRLWLYGDYKTNAMNENEMIDKKYNLLILTPAK